MKRLILILSLLLTAAVALAAPPRLESEKIFDGRYNKDKSVTITIAERNDNSYRTMTVTASPAIIKAMVRAMEKDKPRAEEHTDYRDDKMHYRFLKIINNGEAIRIGLQTDPDDRSGMFFIQGSRKAFK